MSNVYCIFCRPHIYFFFRCEHSQVLLHDDVMYFFLNYRCQCMSYSILFIIINHEICMYHQITGFFLYQWSFFHFLLFVHEYFILLIYSQLWWLKVWLLLLNNWKHAQFTFCCCPIYCFESAEQIFMFSF